MLKRAKDNWQNAFESTLDKSERKAVRDFTNYYKTESDKAITIALQKGSLNEQDLLGVFTRDGFAKRYEALYEGIGLTFANWYAKNFDKYLTKGVSPNQFQEPWRAAFRNLGITVGAQRVTLVQNTAKKTLIKVFRQLQNDPIFQTEGEVVKARMLKKQYNRYNTYQAKRLVRTEATNAANYATMQSAQDIFPGADMQKEWITSMDGREREWHGAANGQIVDFNKPFLVKGESIMRPGQGSAANVINCRCSVAPFPKQNAQTVGIIEGLNIGVSVGQAEALVSRNIDEVKPKPSKIVIKPPQPKQPVAGEVAEDIAEQSVKKPKTLDEVANTNPNVPGNIVELFDNDSGLDLDLFTHFRKPQKLVIKNVRPNQQGGIVTTTKYKSVYETKKVYIHESGHFVADSRKWIVRGLVEKDSAVKPLTRIFDKWAKYSNNKANTQRLWKELNDIKPYESFDTLGKKLGYTNRGDYMADVGALKDTFGALTKERVGGGHGKSYYKNKSFQWHEFIAHAYENKFQGNKLFKSLYRELYDDMIKMVDELNLNY